jgi:hypothetical protein
MDSVVLLSDRGVWGVGGYEILEIEEYLTRPAGGSYFYCTMRHTVTGTVYKRQMYNTVSMMVEAVRGCDWEFGPHEEEHDDEGCARIIEAMSEGYPDPYAYDDDPSRLTSSNYGFHVFS